MCHHTVLCLVAVLASLSSQLFAKKIILMEGYDPEKIQGVWFMWRTNSAIFDEVSCIKFDMEHDAGAGDLYRVLSHWTNTKGQYKKREFNVIDDRTLKARYFFESEADKVALSIMGTDYTSWIVGYGRNAGRDSYFVATRTKVVPEEAKGPIEEILKTNEVERDWQIINQDDCPAEH